ncbi:MAG: glycosyltransferase family 39 protein [Candidatus Woesebacteria bacterium]
MIHKLANFFYALINGFPLALLSIAASFGVVGMVLLLQERLTSGLVWPLGLLMSTFAIWLVCGLSSGKPGKKTKERLLCNVIALVAVVMWCVWNVPLSYQHIMTDSDPATYANASAWLVTHDTLQMFVSNPFGDVPNISPGSPGFDNLSYDSGKIYAQGQHLSQVLMGLGGRLIGVENVLLLAPITGGLALLSVYVFASQVARPRWALVAVAILGVCLPFIHFSRDAFTEPLTMAFIFGGLSALWSANKNENIQGWLLAGLFIGAAIMTRIDSYLAVIGIVLYVLINLALTLPKKRKKVALGSVMFLASIAALSWLAMQDLKIMSLPYFLFHKEYIKQEVVALFAVVAVGVAGVVVCWRTKLLPKLNKLTRSWRVMLVPVIIIGATLVLASRPLWMTAESPKQSVNIANMQTKEGVPIEPRIYTELTVDWVVWYIGPIIALLGIVGLSFVASNAMKDRRQLAIFAVVLMFLVVSIVYVVQPSVSPAQIWASRRMLPVIMPSLVIFGVVMMDIIDKKYLKKLPLSAVFSLFLAISVVIAPLIVSKPFLETRSMTELSLIQGMCEKLPDNAAVLWVGDGQYYLVQATRTYCGAVSAAYKWQPINTKDFSQAISNAKKAGYMPVVATMGDGVEDIKADLGYKFRQVSECTFVEMENRLLGSPRFSEEKTFRVHISVIGE